jgi:hypothetical protein
MEVRYTAATVVALCLIATLVVGYIVTQYGQREAFSVLFLRLVTVALVLIYCFNEDIGVFSRS